VRRPGLRAESLRPRVVDAAVPVLLALVLATAYGATLLPGVGFDDSGELQAKAATWQLPHETGYPSWLLLAQPFRWLPWHDVAWRMNAFSATAAVAACVALYAAGRELALSRTASAAGALALGFGATFWSQAVVAEVYALNAACFAASTWLAVALARRERPLLRWLLPVATGIGAGNHLSFLLYLPLLAGWLVVALPRGRRAELRGPALLHVVVHGACFLLLCALVAERQPGSPAEVASAATRHAVGGQFHSILLAAPLGDVPLRLARWAGLALRELQPLGVVLAVSGAVLAPRGIWLVLLASIAGNVASVCRFLVPDIEVFLLPSWLAAALLLARGFDRLQRAPLLANAQRAADPRVRAAAALATAGALAALLLPALARNAGRASPGTTDARAFVDAVVAAAAADAVVVADWRTATPLWYAQQIEGRRTDLLVEARGWRDLGELVARAPRDRPLYVIAPDDGFRMRHALRAVGPLLEVVRAADPPLPRRAR
jgi:hypothetical protein